MTASSLASNCEPELYLDYTNSSGEINPCGLVAWSFFNDSFSVSPAPQCQTLHQTWAAASLVLLVIRQLSAIYADGSPAD